MKISELKKEAKMKLVGKLPLAVTINLTYLVLTLALSYVTTKIEGIIGAILAIVFAVLSIPFSYGIAASMLNLSRNEVVGVTDFITVGFKNFKRAFFLSLSIFIRVILPIIIFSVALTFSIISGFASAISADVSGAGVSAIVSLLVAVAAMIWLIYKVLSYALSTYILIDNTDMNSKEVIKRSSELMKGSKLKFVGLVFSFFGWYLLCGILAGFAEIANEMFGMIVMYGLSLLLTPYVTFTEINFYEDLAGISDVKEVTVEKVEDDTISQ